VHVVYYLDLFAHRGAHVLHHPQRLAHVVARVVVCAIGRTLGPRRRRTLAAVTAHLDANGAVAFGDEFADVLLDLMLVAAIGMDVDGCRLTALAAKKLVDRHAGLLALDVPQRHIDAGDRVVEHWAVAPVTMHHGHPPGLFDARDIASQHERRDVLFDRGDDGMLALRESGATQAVQPGLGGDDLDDDQMRSFGLGRYHFDIAYRHGWRHRSCLFPW